MCSWVLLHSFLPDVLRCSICVLFVFHGFLPALESSEIRNVCMLTLQYHALLCNVNVFTNKLIDWLNKRLTEVHGTFIKLNVQRKVTKLYASLQWVSRNQTSIALFCSDRRCVALIFTHLVACVFAPDQPQVVVFSKSTHSASPCIALSCL